MAGKYTYIKTNNCKHFKYWEVFFCCVQFKIKVCFYIINNRLKYI